MQGAFQIMYASNKECAGIGDTTKHQDKTSVYKLYIATSHMHLIIYYYKIFSIFSGTASIHTDSGVVSSTIKGLSRQIVATVISVVFSFGGMWRERISTINSNRLP